MTRIDSVAEQMRHIPGKNRNDFALRVMKLLTPRDAVALDEDIKLMVDDSWGNPDFVNDHRNIIYMGVLAGATPTFYKPVSWYDLCRILASEAYEDVADFLINMYIFAGDIDDSIGPEFKEYVLNGVVSGERPDDNDEIVYKDALSMCFIPLYEILKIRDKRANQSKVSLGLD